MQLIKLGKNREFVVNRRGIQSIDCAQTNRDGAAHPGDSGGGYGNGAPGGEFGGELEVVEIGADPAGREQDLET